MNSEVRTRIEDFDRVQANDPDIKLKTRSVVEAVVEYYKAQVKCIVNNITTLEKNLDTFFRLMHHVSELNSRLRNAIHLVLKVRYTRRYVSDIKYFIDSLYTVANIAEQISEGKTTCTERLDRLIQDFNERSLDIGHQITRLVLTYHAR